MIIRAEATLKIIPLSESNSMMGTDGDDLLEGADHRDIIDGGDGNDTIYGSGGRFDNIDGGAGNDFLVGWLYDPDGIMFDNSGLLKDEYDGQRGPTGSRGAPAMIPSLAADGPRIPIVLASVISMPGFYRLKPGLFFTVPIWSNTFGVGTAQIKLSAQALCLLAAAGPGTTP